MEQQAQLSIIRRAYAKQTLAAARISDAAIEDAFAAVPRENFLGNGPWPMYRRPPGTYVTSPDADPVYLYVDQVVGLIPERRINNGQPSLHAMLIAASRIGSGNHVVHIGAGTGYYSAIMAHIVGRTGMVTAIESNPVLAREYLRETSNVRVLEGDGSTLPFDAADLIYVNAGVTHPLDSWLDGLFEGGRLIIPPTTDENFPVAGSTVFNPATALRSGAYFCIQRRGTSFDVRGLMPTVIIPAQGARDRAAEAVLAKAFVHGDWHKVTRLIRSEDIPDDRCWLKGCGWCFTYD